MDYDVEISNLRKRVTHLESLVTSLYTQLKLTYVPNTSTINDPVIHELKAGRYMEAIKVYRDIHGVGLAEGKAAVDKLNAQL